MNLRRGGTVDQLAAEIERKAQSRELRVFSSVPDIKLLRDNEIVRVDDGGTQKLITRIGKNLYSTDLTKVV